ncbi:flagellar M-ring protein FliF [Rhodovarius crocodyli]|uniref:Flagellar M-ring protein n=1 Tax=Rhodovarius crocodyli TaxID=1979269 RepID=A0A437LZ75_9PROT|nr:flagellar basal-body MS-ring/collar protein FliF [Rhodovarius crocodyli]RVT90665.1 flagellar M-ring protein FliF [Rhodovarius crocodyli]
MKQIIDNLMALGRLRLAAIAGVAAALLIGIGFLTMRASTPPMALLYGELDARDGGAVIAALDRQRVPYRVAAGGSQIMVPADDVARLRLMLARDGLPAGGSVGYELFDRSESLTTTPFQQDMNRVRALEGELSRTIRGLAGVRNARVHLVLPRREAFSRERGEAQASVVLGMVGSQRLDREGVQAVLHLVAMAVPGLAPRNVSIVDSRGELLARGGQTVGGSTTTQEDVRRAQEMRLSRAVEEMLERTVGPGRVRAEVSLDMDFDRVETREERFDPENSVPRSTQSVQETNRSQEPGNVSVQNNLPGGDNGAGAGTQESRQEETTNFEIGRTTRNTLREHPNLRRMSVAVLVDGVAEVVDGQARVRERTTEELQRLTALVRSAVGFNEQRGDRVEIVSMRFAEPQIAEPARGPLGLDLPQATIARLIETAVISVVGLLAILLIGRPVARRLAISLAPAAALAGPGGVAAAIGPDGQPVPAAIGADGKPVASLPGAALPGATHPDGTPLSEDDMVSVANIEGRMRASSIARLSELVRQQPDEALAVLRRWLTPGDDL